MGPDIERNASIPPIRCYCTPQDFTIECHESLEPGPKWSPGSAQLSNFRGPN